MGSAPRGFPIKRDNRGRTVPFTLRATPILETSVFLPLLLQAPFLLAAVALPPPSILPSSPSRHGAKIHQGQGSGQGRRSRGAAGECAGGAADAVRLLPLDSRRVRA